MPGRAKGKRFVIRGKERLDVGLQEDEFLLQAVFDCMGAGPNPARRPSMLAPPRRQNLIPPPGHANRPAQIPPAGRPCWRRPAGKALSHRRATPTGRPESRPAAVHVGAAPSAKPYPTAGKTLFHRRATPTGQPESCPAAVHVGAAPPAKPYPTAGPRQQSGTNPACRPSMLALSRRQSLIPPPAKPYPTAGPRQQAGPNPACRPPMLAPLRRQSLIPPPGHANRTSQIPPGGRPCCRRPLRVGGGSDILHLRRVNLNSCKWRTEYETDSSNGPRRNFGGVCDSGFCSCRGGIGN